MMKQDNQEVNMTNQGDHNDHGDHGYCGKQSLDQKEKRHFRHLDDIEKWCEIHYTIVHDLKECKTFLDCKKMLIPNGENIVELI
jgi:hypothetical protein